MGSVNTKFVLRIALVSALGGFLFGYDWVVIGGAKFFYERFFSITGIPHLQGIAMSSALIGCIPGAMWAGYLSDRFGRKTSLITASVIFILSALGTGYSPSLAWFLFFRILGGLGIGLASCISPIYIAEVTPKEMRGKFVSLNQLNIVIGILLAQITNYLIAQEVPEGSTDTLILSSWNGQMGWRWMFWAEAVPATLFFALALFIPESPRWFITRGQTVKAVPLLTRIGGPEYAESVIESAGNLPGRSSSGFALRSLLAKNVRPIVLIGIVLAVFQQWCGINIVFNYAEEVFTSAGFGISDSLFNILITGLVNLAFTFVAIRTVDRWGRRKLLLVGSSGLAVSYTVLGISYFSGWSGVSALTIILIAIAIYAMSLAPVTWVVLSEIFPNRVRSAAMATATTTLWIASALLVLLFPIIKDLAGISGAFWIYAFICILGFLFIRSRIPETRGKSLEEIEQHLMEKSPHR
jgi:sugar porter (SP) family MFS transporter